MTFTQTKESERKDLSNPKISDEELQKIRDFQNSMPTGGGDGDFLSLKDKEKAELWIDNPVPETIEKDFKGDGNFKQKYQFQVYNMEKDKEQKFELSSKWAKNLTEVLLESRNKHVVVKRSGTGMDDTNYVFIPVSN